MDWELPALVVPAAWLVGKAIFVLLAKVSLWFCMAFAAASVAAALRTFKRRLPPNGMSEPRGGPLRLGADVGAEFPSVTILKPLKGADQGLYENLASFCAQDYPAGLQILFAVCDPADPAVGTVARLRRDFPAVDIELVVSRRRMGFNPKINNIANAYPYAKHELLLLSDSDIKAAPGYLREAAAAFADREVGLATSFYRSTVPSDLCGALEALSVNAQFLPQALVAGAAGMRFAMGAAILVRRDVFERLGGFAALAEHLADDYALGAAVAEAGWRIEFTRPVVDSVPDIVSFADLLRHQTRWARTIRTCNPVGYAGTGLLHGFSLAVLALVLFGWNGPLAALAAAMITVKGVATYTVLRLSGARVRLAPLMLLPLSEIIAFASWVAGFRSKHVVWRGARYEVEARGRLVPAVPLLEETAAAES